MAEEQQIPAMPAVFRAFFAAEIPHELQEKIMKIVQPLKRSKHWRNVRWSKVENLHITLRFLGNINREQYAKIIPQVKEALGSIAPFIVEFAKVELFPSQTMPHILTINPRPIVKLKELAIILDKIVVACGVKPETRPFTPHLTLGRFKYRHKLSEAALLELVDLSSSKDGRELALEKLNVNEVILYRSMPTEKGSKYIPLDKLVLGN